MNVYSNVLSIGTTDTVQAERLFDFIQSCVAKVEHSRRGKVAVSYPHPVHSFWRAKREVNIVADILTRYLAAVKNIDVRGPTRARL